MSVQGFGRTSCAQSEVSGWRVIYPYQPPSPDVDLASNGAGPKLDQWRDIYFSFQGRIPRKTYWVLGMLGMLAFIVAAGIWAYRPQAQ